MGAFELEYDIAAAEAVPLTPSMEEIFDPLKTGFLWYTPPLASEKEHKTGGHEWTIAGHDMQILTMTMPPGEQVITERGSFMYGSPNLDIKVELTLCTRGGCSEGCNRIFGGESCVKLVLKNPPGAQGYVGLTPNFPAKVIPIKFGTHIDSGRSLIAQPGAYMSQIGDVDVGCDLDCGLATCCCGGLGMCRQKLAAPDDSIAFLAAGGTIVYKHLDAGEKIIVDSGSVLGFEDSVKLGITSNGNFCTWCCGGEGCCSTTLTGPGRVYMQSMSFPRFVAAVGPVVIEREDGKAGGGLVGTALDGA